MCTSLAVVRCFFTGLHRNQANLEGEDEDGEDGLTDQSLAGLSNRDGLGMMAIIESVQPHRDARPDSPIISHAGASFFCLRIAQQDSMPIGSRPWILVAGSGYGHEAIHIGDAVDASVVAVDINFPLEHGRHGGASLAFSFASVEQLPFKDGSFDAVFYHHVIEHVGDPRGSIREMARVLRPRGIMFIGTPNRHRILSAVGSSDNPHWKSTFSNKLRENIHDWAARARGRFRNEDGAHAGFTRRELNSMLTPFFSRITWLTREYLLFKYETHRLFPIIRVAANGPQLEFLAPSIYAECEKR